MSDNLNEEAHEMCAAAWQEGWDAAHEMARLYGHVDSWWGTAEVKRLGANPYLPQGPDSLRQFITVPCTECPAGPGEWCQSEGVWIHLSRFKENRKGGLRVPDYD